MRGILIIGGSGGIGVELIKILRSHDQEVFFTYNKEKELSSKIGEELGAIPVQYNFNSIESRENLCNIILSGKLSGLVNLAAEPVTRSNFLKINCELVISKMNSEILSTLLICQAFAKSCKARNEGGSIVNVLTSYILGIPPEKLIGYVMTKQALLGMTRSLALELSKIKVRVNSVSPEMTKTKFISDLPERFIEITEESLPFKRIAQPFEVASVIHFLLSSGSSYISGANIPITGAISC